MSASRNSNYDGRGANPMGAYVAIAGILLFNVAVFLQWYDNENGETVSGFEGDSLVPFIAYLGVGFAVAMLYAQQRAGRGQHRGLSLAAMAVGLAATLQMLATIIDVPGSWQHTGADLTAEIGVYVALVGAAVWTAGAFLLAKEPEGDTDRTLDTTEATLTR